MRIDGIQLVQGSNISNLVVASGTSFPSLPDEGELFFRTDAAASVKGLYAYIGGSWDRVASTDSLSTPLGATLPGTANQGDLFYRDSNDANEGLYVYTGAGWVAASAGVASSFTVTGDVTGTLDGGTDVLTLATVATAGTTGSANSSTLVTINAKGLVTSVSTTPIDISTAQVTTGTFADARIAESNVTQHQAALSLSAMQLSSGVLADVRVAASNVTQHQAVLSIAETQIPNGTLLARLADAETVSGSWTFSNPVVGATPTLTTHLSTKDYVDTTVGALGPTLSLTAAQTTSGTFADARISQSSVTQHQAALAITEAQITDGTLLARLAANETVTGSYQFNNPVVIAAPSTGSHAATKNYVDQAIAGLSWKNSTRVATTANITLSGTQTIDGVAVVAGNRVLVKNQTTTSENGVYVVAAGAWTRASDFDSIAPIDEINSAAVFVQQGSTQSDTAWTQTLAVTTVGTDAIAFTQFSGVNTFFAGSGMSLTGNTFNVNTASSARIVINTDDIDLAAIGTAGTYKSVTTDAYGRVTAGTNPTTLAGYGITDAMAAGTGVLKTGDTMTGALTTTGLTSSGNVFVASKLGIGTAPATYDFEINKASGSAMAQVLSNTGVSLLRMANPSTAVVFGVDNATGSYTGSGVANAPFLWVQTTSPQVPLLFGNNNTERMRLTALGDLAIATTNTPSAGLNLANTKNVAFVESATDSIVNIFRQAGSAGTVIASGYKYTGTSNGFASSYGSSWAKSAIVLGSANGAGSIGFYSDAATTVAVGTDATPTLRMLITNAGNVGIGGAPIANRLEVYHSTNGIGMRVRNTTTNVELATRTDATTAGIDAGNAAGGMTFSINTIEHVRLGANGNMAIGTTSVDAGRLTVATPMFAGAESGKLSQRWFTRYNGGVNGYNAYLKSTGNFGYVLNTDWGARLSLGVNTNTANDDTTFTEHLTIISNGNVGIGTNAPGNRLHVYTPATTNTAMVSVQSANSSIFTINSPGSAGAYAPASQIGDVVIRTEANALHIASTSGLITLGSPATERARITSTGEVLIGATTNPFGGTMLVQKATGQASVDVYNVSGGDAGIRFYNANNNSAIMGGDGALKFYANSAATERMRLDSAGNLLVGTGTAYAKFVVIGNALLGSGLPDNTATPAYSGTYFGFDGPSNLAVIQATNPSTAGLAFHTKSGTGVAPAERMRIDSAGVVMMNRTTTSGLGQLQVAISSGNNIADFSGSSGSAAVVRVRATTVDSAYTYYQNSTTGTTLSDGMAVGIDSTGVGYINNFESQHVIVASAGTERLRVNSAGITVTGTVTETSTIRVKENVRPLEGALEKVMGLRGVVYDMKDGSASNQIGLIAEEVHAVVPNVVYRDEEGDIAGVQYARLVAVLIEGMKEQEARIKALEAALAAKA